MAYMMEEDQRPSDLWEESYTKFENYVKTKNFKANSKFEEVASEIRGMFMIIVNYHHTFPKYDSSQEALDLTRNCLAFLDEIRQNNHGDQNFFQPYLKV